MKKLIAFIIVAVISITVTYSALTYYDISSDVRYYKDSRTGLCFAAVNSGGLFKFSSHNFSITCVPCSPSVNKLLQ